MKANSMHEQVFVWNLRKGGWIHLLFNLINASLLLPATVFFLMKPNNDILSILLQVSGRHSFNFFSALNPVCELQKSF